MAGQAQLFGDGHAAERIVQILMRERMRNRVAFRCTPEQREQILTALRGTLSAHSEVVFAYAYGSSLEGLPFHDVDVGVYLAMEDRREQNLFALELALELERVVAPFFKEQRNRLKDNEGSKGGKNPRPCCPSVDVRVLNRAPVSFCYHVLRGRLFFSGNEDLRVCWAVRAATRYLDLKPLRHRALKEAMLSWS